MMCFSCYGLDEIEELHPSEIHVDASSFGRCFFFQAHVWIHEVVNGSLHVQEIFRSFVASKITHRFGAVSQISIIALYRIVVVFKPIFLTGDWDAEFQFARPKEQFVECTSIVSKPVGYKFYELSFLYWLLFFFFINVENLTVASILYLPEKFHTFGISAFFDVKMG